MRHAESEENLHMKTHEYGDAEGFSDDEIYNKLFDCHLSENGVLQAQLC